MMFACAHVPDRNIDVIADVCVYAANLCEITCLRKKVNNTNDAGSNVGL